MVTSEKNLPRIIDEILTGEVSKSWSVLNFFSSARILMVRRGNTNIKITTREETVDERYGLPFKIL